MNRSGHVGAALVAYAPVAFVATAVGLEDLAFLGALASVGLAMLPDIDLRLPLVPHRGPTHTVWFALAASVAGASVGWNAGIADGIATSAGFAGFGAVVAGGSVGSHILADALTPMGARPYAPLSDRHLSFDITRASNPLSNGLVLALGAGLAVGAFALGGWVAAL